MKVNFWRNQRRYLLEAEGKAEGKGDHIDEGQLNRATNVRRQRPVRWGRKAMPWKPSTRESLLPEQRQAEDTLRKASLWVFIIYRLCLNRILKDMLQEERKLQHMEDLKCEIGFWAKNLAKVWYTQTSGMCKTVHRVRASGKHHGAGLGNSSM